MRIGLVGAGRIGTTHAGVLASTPGVDGLAIDPRNYLTPRQGRRRGS